MEYVFTLNEDRFYVDTVEVADWVQVSADRLRSSDGPCAQDDAADFERVANQLKEAASAEDIEQALWDFRHLDTSARDALPDDGSVPSKAFNRLVHHFGVDC